MKKTLSHVNCMKRATYTLVALATLGLIQPALSSVTVHFVQEGPDVRISFSGSINVDPSLVDDPSAGPFLLNNIFQSDGVAAMEADIFLDAAVGVPTEAGFTRDGGTFTPGDGSGFGFGKNDLFYRAGAISGGAVGAVSQLTADPGIDTMVVSGKTLADLNADAGSIAEGATLWTATTTGDTFVFSRIAPVPEPSEIALVAGIGLLGLGLVQVRATKCVRGV